MINTTRTLESDAPRNISIVLGAYMYKTITSAYEYDVPAAAEILSQIKWLLPEMYWGTDMELDSVWNEYRRNK